MTQQDPPELNTDRQVKSAIVRGLACKCPACGKGHLFSRYLKPASSCSACGEDLSGHRADDFPAYIVILLLGHLLVPTMIEVNYALDIPTGWQAMIWPSLALALALTLIQPVKGGVIAFQWARRMHGFSRQNLPEI